jgi:hypothetical protein
MIIEMKKVLTDYLIRGLINGHETEILAQDSLVELCAVRDEFFWETNIVRGCKPFMHRLVNYKMENR